MRLLYFTFFLASLLFSACTPKIDTDAYLSLEDVQGSWYFIDTIDWGIGFYNELHIIKDRFILHNFEYRDSYITNRVAIDSGDTWYRLNQESRYYPNEVTCFTRNRNGSILIHGFYFHPWELQPLPEGLPTHLDVLNAFGYEDLGDAYKRLPNYRTHQLLADSLQCNFECRRMVYFGGIDSASAYSESYSMFTEDSISYEHPYYLHYDTVRRNVLNRRFELRNTYKANNLLRKIDRSEMLRCNRNNIPVRDKLKGDRWSYLLMAPIIEIEDD